MVKLHNTVLLYFCVLICPRQSLIWHFVSLNRIKNVESPFEK